MTWSFDAYFVCEVLYKRFLLRYYFFIYARISILSHLDSRLFQISQKWSLERWFKSAISWSETWDNLRVTVGQQYFITSWFSFHTNFIPNSFPSSYFSHRSFESSARNRFHTCCVREYNTFYYKPITIPLRHDETVVTRNDNTTSRCER